MFKKSVLLAIALLTISSSWRLAQAALGEERLMAGVKATGESHDELYNFTHDSSL